MWDYVTPHEGSVEQSLRALQQKVFDQEFAHGCNPDYFGSPMETYGSLEELWADEEFMENVGTHTVIDVYRLVAVDEGLGAYEQYNTIRPLSDERLQHFFATTKPSLRQYQEAIDHSNHAMNSSRVEHVLTDEADAGWTARYVVLYTDGKPSHMGVFGSSGD